MSLLDRLLGRVELPPDFAGRLDPDERVLAAAGTTDGGPLVLTPAGIWLPEQDGAARRLGWHLVSKASWAGGALTITEATEVDVVDGVVLLADRPPRRLRLVDPGRVPELVQARVEGSIRGRRHEALPGGGAWVVQRKVPGRDGLSTQVRADPGTDEAAVRRLAAALAAPEPGPR